MSEYAIQIHNLKKRYRLGQIGGGTLRADLQSLWARLRGKDDPNALIGTDSRQVGQTFMALNGIDLKVKKGEALGIIGGNGAGKSTMLKILSRITAPTEGTVDIEGRVASMLEVGTGFNREMTGRENVYLNGAILGMSKAEIDRKMEQIIEFSEIREFIDTPVKRYSSGMFVKLAFSVAAHLDAEIMIMDEVLAVGDMAFQKKCLEKMRAAAEVQGRTVLYVSHNMNTIRRLCKRCVVLHEGKLVFDGDTEAAIAVYLKMGGVGEGTEKDLQTAPRLHGQLGQRARLVSMALPGRENITVARGEKPEIAFGWQAGEDFENVCLRLLVRDSQDNVLGMAQSAALPAMRSGESRVDTLRFDTGSLCPGTYYLSPVLFHKGSGAGIILDNVPRALTIEVVSAPGDSVENWDPERMGRIRFPDMEIS